MAPDKETGRTLTRHHFWELLMFGLMLSGFALALTSGLTPWYQIYVYNGSTLVGIDPWFVTEMRCLSSGGPLLGGASGLTLTAAVLFLRRRSNLSADISVATMGALMLPWVGTPSLYILTGHPIGNPRYNMVSIPEYGQWPRIALGFFLNLAASILLVAAVTSVLWVFRNQKRISGGQRLVTESVALLCLGCLLIVNGYVPWYSSISDPLVPRYLLPLTLGASLISVGLLKWRIGPTPLGEVTLVWTGFLMLSAAANVSDLLMLSFSSPGTWSPAQVLLTGLALATLALGIKFGLTAQSQTV